MSRCDEPRGGVEMGMASSSLGSVASSATVAVAVAGVGRAGGGQISKLGPL